jgi:hypothetical protein
MSDPKSLSREELIATARRAGALEERLRFLLIPYRSEPFVAAALIGDKRITTLSGTSKAAY